MSETKTTDDVKQNKMDVIKAFETFKKALHTAGQSDSNIHNLLDMRELEGSIGTLASEI